MTVETLDEVTAREHDLRSVRVDTFRATGPGGQHRNKTDSGVRLTHPPTGIVVTATEDRSQHVNREVAWARLRSRLEERDAAASNEARNATRAGVFGQDRSFMWTAWRDQVRTSENRTTSMSTALKGRLGPLLA